MGTGAPLPGVKRPGRELSTHLQLVSRSRKCGSIHPLPTRLHGAVLNYLSTETLPYLYIVRKIYFLKEFIRLMVFNGFGTREDKFCTCIISYRSRDNAVDIPTGYWPDNRAVGVRVSIGSRIFSSPQRPGRLRAPPSLLSNGYRG
jgi:hypothetical protein